MKTGKFQGLLLSSLLMASPMAFADDSSSDAADGFLNVLQSSKGLIVKVPVNEAGEELVGAAETRVYKGEALTSTSDYAKAFETGTAVSTDAVVTDRNLAVDSSTSGWYYGSPQYGRYSYYRSPGYWSRGYYNSYNPSYYSYGSYYPYYRPSWRTYTSYRSPQYGYYGQRYYHYGRRW